MTKSPDSSVNPPGVFMLRVGAQKAGTSWLHQQLHTGADADFGCLKEYHVLDARTIAELKRFRQLNCKPLQPRPWLRQCFIHNPEHYGDYFPWLLSKPRLRGAHILLTGGLTPSYALLSTDTLKSINTNFQACGIAVKPVFLMRNPIEWLISSKRMKLRKQGLRDAASWPPCTNGLPRSEGCLTTMARPSILEIRPLVWSTALLAFSKPCSQSPPTQSSATS